MDENKAPRVRNDRIWQTFTLSAVDNDDKELNGFLKMLAKQGRKSSWIRETLLLMMHNEQVVAEKAQERGPYEEPRYEDTEDE